MRMLSFGSLLWGMRMDFSAVRLVGRPPDLVRGVGTPVVSLPEFVVQALPRCCVELAHLIQDRWAPLRRGPPARQQGGVTAGYSGSPSGGGRGP